jgi:hypothetical protein
MWFKTVSTSDNELAARLKHEGIRAGEIIAYRAWRVMVPGWFRDGDDRLHSVFRQDYVWHPDEPASGDVRTHGIYSFRNVIPGPLYRWLLTASWQQNRNMQRKRNIGRVPRKKGYIGRVPRKKGNIEKVLRKRKSRLSVRSRRRSFSLMQIDEPTSKNVCPVARRPGRENA